jgi:hypothetical protein
MRGLLIPTSGFPEILYEDINEVELMIFKNQRTIVSTFDGTVNYVHLEYYSSLSKPTNVVATFLKRLYTKNYVVKNSIRGDVLVYSSSQNLPHLVNSSVPQYFVEQVISHYVNNPYVLR